MGKAIETAVDETAETAADEDEAAMGKAVDGATETAMGKAAETAVDEAAETVTVLDEAAETTADGRGSSG